MPKLVHYLHWRLCYIWFICTYGVLAPCTRQNPPNLSVTCKKYVYFSHSWKFQNFVSYCTKMKTKFAIFFLFLHKWRQPITWSLNLAKAKLHHKDDILRSFNSCKFEHKLSWEHEDWVWDHLTHEISSQAKVEP
jgi:hypothetical protein